MHAQIFCIYMLVIAFAYFLYLFADIRCHIDRAKKQYRERHQRAQNIAESIKKERCAVIESENQVLFSFYAFSSTTTTKTTLIGIVHMLLSIW